MKITKGTLIRTVVLLLALVNQILSICGVSPLNIADDDVSTVISTLWTIVSALVAWWKNNSFTDTAITADCYKEEIRSQNEEAMG